MSACENTSLPVPFDHFNRFNRFSAASRRHGGMLFSCPVRVAAIVETLAFLSALVALDMLFGSGLRFRDMAMHPFWIIVVLTALQYGVAEALAAAALSTFFLLAGNLPEQQLTETMYDYLLRIGTLPLLWVGAALVLGSIRTRQVAERDEMAERLSQAEEAAHAIVAGYNALKQVKEKLEARLAEEKRGVLTVYSAAKELEVANAGDVSIAAAKLVATALDPFKFSIYRWDDAVMRLTTMQGWQEDDRYPRELSADEPLVRALLLHKRVLCITRPEDEPILAGQGVLAGLLMDVKTGTVYGMLKIEDMRFMDLGVRTAEIFRILCEWIGGIFAGGERNRLPRMHGADGIVYPENSLDSEQLLAFQAQYLTRLAHRHGLTLYKLTIRLENCDEMTPLQRHHAAFYFKKMAREQLGEADLLFHAQGDEALAALLMCEDEEEARYTATRIQIAMTRLNDPAQAQAQASYHYEIEPLHQGGILPERYAAAPAAHIIV